jgi:uncharacterized phage protein (TIGR02218 family)
MTYATREASVSDAAPIELYELRAPGYLPYRYTSAAHDVIRLGQTFITKPLKRSELKVATQDADDHYLEVTLPASDPYVKAFGVRIAPLGLEMMIWRYHDGDDPADAIPLWLGPITSITIAGDDAKIRTSSIFGAMLSGNLPSVYFQAPCNWTLYDDQCGVNRDLWSFTATVVNLAENSIELNAWNPAFDSVSFLGGELVLPRNGERRSIALRAGNDVLVTFPFADLKVGDTVRLSAGCNHSFNDCKNKFNNAVNYGGCRYIPWINVFADGI